MTTSRVTGSSPPSMSASTCNCGGRVHSVEWATKATDVLQRAIFCERSKKWKQAIRYYRVVLDLLAANQSAVSHGRERPEWLTTLRYECYYHVGIAMLQTGQRKRAIGLFTKAIESVYVYRGGCSMDSCHTNSCLMTPVYAVRTLAHALSGNLTEALKDAEAAVVLDTKNPDVYCVRSLVRSERNEMTHAKHDIRKALDINANHLCALILCGQLKTTHYRANTHDQNRSEAHSSSTSSKDVAKLCKHHRKACSLNPVCYSYLNVGSFSHPDILNFYNRFLFSLTVPHTIIDLTIFIPPSLSTSSDWPSRISTAPVAFQRQVSSSSGLSTSCSARPTASVGVSRSLQSGADVGVNGPCGEFHNFSSVGGHVDSRRPYSDVISVQSGGIPLSTSCSSLSIANGHGARAAAAAAVTTTISETDIGIEQRNAVARHATPHSTSPSRTTRDDDVTRASSNRRGAFSACNFKAGTCPGFASPPSAPLRTKSNAESVIEHCSNLSATEQRRAYSQRLKQQAKSQTELREASNQSAGKANTLQQKSLVVSTVFSEKLDVRNMPRMYYKPWLGDRLPAADHVRYTTSQVCQPFKV